MSGLLYFLPKRGAGVTRKQICDAGLSYLPDAGFQACECTNGPSGEPGVIVGFGDSSSPVGYHPNKQRWRRIPAAGNSSDGTNGILNTGKVFQPGAGAWVGACCDQPIAATEFARPSLLPGHAVELADGNKWIVPIARGFTEHEDSLSWLIALPTIVGLGDDGRWMTGGVVPKYAKLWATANKFWDVLQSEINAGGDDDEPVTLQFDELQDAAVIALQANYAIGPAEVALLGLFDTTAAQRILLALVDWPTLEAFNKKKRASEALNSTAGSGDATPATDPA